MGLQNRVIEFGIAWKTESPGFTYLIPSLVRLG
jgi:hypothetical protein